MRLKLQFAGWLIALGMGGALAVPAFAQGPRANWAQSRQDDKPPKQQQRQPQQQRQEQRRENRQPRQEARRPQNERQNSGANRPPNSNANRAEMITRPNANPNRPPSAYTPPPQRKYRDLSPQEQRKVVENYNKQRNLSPGERQELNRRADQWQKLTPEQKDHVRNDLAPQWKQLPDGRRRAIQQRLGVLQNMPESARNQHLNDPNFTRGMSDEDKAMLRDLSHLHVGAPDPPSE